VPVNTPDFSGGLESGFAAAVQAMIALDPIRRGQRRPARPPAPAAQRTVRPSLTPGDLEALRS
jgi:hypothetical protein